MITKAEEHPVNENRNYSNNENVAADEEKKAWGTEHSTIISRSKRRQRITYLQMYRGTSTTKRKGLIVDKPLLRATGIYQAVEIQNHQRNKVKRVMCKYIMEGKQFYFHLNFWKSFVPGDILNGTVLF